MLAFGNSVYSARLEMIGQGVVVDNVRVTVSEGKSAAKAKPFQPIVTILILKEAPRFSGGFSLRAVEGCPGNPHGLHEHGDR